jgi:two-component system response regulator AtoC
VALARYDHIGVEDLPERLQTYRRTAPLPLRDTPTEMPLRELERRHILHVLETVAGNRRLAARMLGVDRKTLSRKLARFDLPG